MSTYRGEIKVCAWLLEISFCSCLTVLPGPAWVLLGKTNKPLFSLLYMYLPRSTRSFLPRRANWSAHNRRGGEKERTGNGGGVISFGDRRDDRVLRDFKADSHSTTETDFKCNLLFRLHSAARRRIRILTRPESK